MATRTWSSAGSTDMNLATNYSGSGELLATDDLVFDATSTVNATATAPLSVNSVVTAAAYSGNWSISGQTLTCAAGASFDGTGTLNLGNGVTCNGASSTAHFGSTLGAVTATSAAMLYSGTTGMVIDDDKGITFKTISLADNAKVTNSGAASSTYLHSSTPITLGDGASLTINRNMTSALTAAGSFISLPASYTIAGSATLYLSNQSAATCTIPAITATVGVIEVQGPVTNSATNMNGAMSCTSLVVETTAVVSFTFNTQNYGIAVTGNLNCGSNNAGANLILNFGSSTISCGAFAATGVFVQATTYNMQSSQWTCAGNWTWKTGYTVNAGTSTVTISNTSTVTNVGKSFYRFNVDASGNTITLADDLVCARYTLLAGSVDLAGHTITQTGLLGGATMLAKWEDDREE